MPFRLLLVMIVTSLVRGLVQIIDRSLGLPPSLLMWCSQAKSASRRDSIAGLLAAHGGKHP